MSSLSPCMPHGKLTCAKFKFFSLSGFGENYVQIFPLIQLRPNMSKLATRSLLCLKFCIDWTSGCRENIFKAKIYRCGDERASRARTHTRTHARTHTHNGIKTCMDLHRCAESLTDFHVWVYQWRMQGFKFNAKKRERSKRTILKVDWRLSQG